MRLTAAPASPARSCAPCKEPLPDRGGQVRRLLGVAPGDVDLGDQRVQRTAVLARRGVKCAPEHRLETDRGLVPGDEHRALPWWSVARLHQYMCWPPLIERVDPVTNPAY